MDYYNGGDILEDEWVWNPEEEKKSSRASDVILYSPEEQQKVGREKEKVMLEKNVGVGEMQDKGEAVGQEDTIQDVEGEDSAEDDAKDTYWGRRFEADLLRKEVSDWLAGQRIEQDDYLAGQVDALELRGSRLMELVRQSWEENMDQWAQRTEDLRVPSLENMAENLARQAGNLEAPRLESMILFFGVAVTILGSLVFAGFTYLSLLIRFTLKRM